METTRRRTIQAAYNEEHGITPITIQKKIRDVIRATVDSEEAEEYVSKATSGKKLKKEDRMKLIALLESEMKAAAKALDFEKAAELRDTVLELKAEG